MSNFHEKTLRAEIRYVGKIVSVEVQDVELETGQVAIREIVRHRGAVAVLPRRPDGRFLFVRQFRKPAEQMLLEVVAGVLELDEDPADAARRELREETGYEAATLRPLGEVYPSPGYIDERIRIFAAEVGERPGERALDHDERVEVVDLAGSEFEQLVRRGQVVDGKTLAVWTLYRASLGGMAP